MYCRVHSLPGVTPNPLSLASILIILRVFAQAALSSPQAPQAQEAVQERRSRPFGQHPCRPASEWVYPRRAPAGVRCTSIGSARCAQGQEGW